MRNCLKLFFVLFIIFVPFLCHAQAKIYTKKAMLEDFLTSTTKVVLSGDSPLELAVRGEVTSRWRVSPYEFCSLEEYERIKTDNSLYFLRLVAGDGVVFLSLDKGGKENDPDRFRRPFEVIQFPIALDGYMTGDEAIYMGAFLDIIQDFAAKAMTSDMTGYAGLASYNTRNMSGKKVYLDSYLANEVFQKEEPDAIIPVLIVPVNGSTYYKMLISADTHEIFYFSRGKVSEKHEEGFTPAEKKLFERRHADIVG